MLIHVSSCKARRDHQSVFSFFSARSVGSVRDEIAQVTIMPEMSISRN